jgi:hypothetical protein
LPELALNLDLLIAISWVAGNIGNEPFSPSVSLRQYHLEPKQTKILFKTSTQNKNRKKKKH